MQKRNCQMSTYGDLKLASSVIQNSWNATCSALLSPQNHLPLLGDQPQFQSQAQSTFIFEFQYASFSPVFGHFIEAISLSRYGLSWCSILQAVRHFKMFYLTLGILYHIINIINIRRM